MRKLLKPAIFVICFLSINLLFFHSTFAADTESSHITETVLLGNLKDDGSACGVFTILNIAVDIFSAGVAILALIGITIVGVNYLTAGGNEEQTRKAKHRMFQIVIGITAYALLYAGVQWLIPGGKLDFSQRCVTVSDSELAKIKEKEQSEKEAQRKKNEEAAATNKPNNNDSSSSSPNKSTDNASLVKWYTAIDQQAEYMKNAEYGSNYKSNFKLSKSEGTCITYVSTALQRLGVIPKNTYIWYNCGMTGTAAKTIKKKTSTFQVSYPNKTVKALHKQGKIVKGDIVFYQYGSECGVGHTMIFMGFNKNGKPIFNTFGHKGMKTNNAHSDGDRKVKMLIHLKKS